MKYEKKNKFVYNQLLEIDMHKSRQIWVLIWVLIGVLIGVLIRGVDTNWYEINRPGSSEACIEQQN